MKLIIKLLALLIFAAVILGVAGYFLVPPAASKAVDEGSRFAFGVPASLGSVTASPGLGSTSVGFEGYELSSPTGFDEKLLSIGKFNVGVGTKSLIGGTKDVDGFVLENVNLTLVQDGLQNNLVPVLKHLKGLVGASGDVEDVPAPEGEREGSPGPKLRLGDVRFEGISATLKLRGVPGIAEVDQTFTVPAYTTNLASLTGTEGRTVAEIAAHLVEDLKERALASADGKVPAQALTALRKTLDGGLEGGLGGALDAGKEALGAEAQKQLDAAKGKAGDAINDLKGNAADEAKKLLNEDVLGKDGKKLLDGFGKNGEKAVDDALKGAEGEAKKALKGLLGGGD